MRVSYSPTNYTSTHERNKEKKKKMCIKMTKDCAFEISTFFISTILYCVYLWILLRCCQHQSIYPSPVIYFSSTLSHTLSTRPSSLIGIQFLNNITSSTLPLLMRVHILFFLEVQEMASFVAKLFIDLFKGHDVHLQVIATIRFYCSSFCIKRT